MASSVIEVSASTRNGHIALKYENYMLVWGGNTGIPCNVANTYYNGSEIWIYSFISEKWYIKKCCSTVYPPGLTGSAAVVIDHSLYLFGGHGDNGVEQTNKLYKLDLNTFIWELMMPTGIPPIPTEKMVGWQYKEKFYIFGGFGIQPHGPHFLLRPNWSCKFRVSDHYTEVSYYNRDWSNQFFVYDPKENSWSTPSYSGTLPSIRSSHAATIINGKVYIFGGRDEHFSMNDMHCLDMETMHWSGQICVENPIPDARYSHSLTAISDQYLILYGGLLHREALSDCWMFDTRTRIWQEIQLTFQKAFASHTACLSIYNEVLIYGRCIPSRTNFRTFFKQATEIVVIRLAPKSLSRLCLDKLVELPEYHLRKNDVPCKIKIMLQHRMGIIYPDL